MRDRDGHQHDQVGITTSIIGVHVCWISALAPRLQLLPLCQNSTGADAMVVVDTTGASFVIVELPTICSHFIAIPFSIDVSAVKAVCKAATRATCASACIAI